MLFDFINIHEYNEQICEKSVAHLNLAISLRDGGMANFNKIEPCRKDLARKLKSVQTNNTDVKEPA